MGSCQVYLLAAALMVASSDCAASEIVAGAGLVLNPLSGLFRWNGQALIPDVVPIDMCWMRQSESIPRTAWPFPKNFRRQSHLSILSH
jgi:hypothetical protein